jgi:hypothetical protein
VAKATFPCARCGASITVGGTTYNRKRADSYADYCAKRGDVCEVCKRADFEAANAKAAVVTAEAGLAPLTGTDKQVAWANTIRLEMLPRIDEAAQKAVASLGRAYSALSPGAQGEIRDAVALIASEMRSSTDARWWIDYRTVHLPDLILRELSARAASLAPTAHAEAARGDR